MEELWPVPLRHSKRHQGVFRDREGLETVLVYRGAEPYRAGISLDLRDDEVILRRSLDHGRELPSNGLHRWQGD